MTSTMSGAPPPPPPNLPPGPAPSTWATPARPMGRPIDWSLVSTATKALGLLLVFVGTLVGVIGLNPSTTPNVGFMYDAVFVTRLLWTLGLGALAAGAGIKLRYVLGPSSSVLSDGQARVMVASQWRNSLTFLVALILLVWILTFLP